MDPRFSFKDKLLVLRLNLLRHTPPALYSTQILSESKLPVLAFEFSMEHKTETVLQDGIPIRRFGLSFLLKFPRPLRAALMLCATTLYLIRHIAKEGKPQIIVTHGLQEQFIAGILNKCFAIPFGTHMHEIYDYKDLRGINKILLFLERYVLKNAAFTIFPTEERQEIYYTRYNLTQPSYKVFNTPRKRKSEQRNNPYRELGISKESKVVLFIGGISPFNAIHELIEAFEYVPKPHVLVVAGWGEESYINKLHTLLEKKNLNSRVYLVGPVKNKWDWIENADLGTCFYAPLELRLKYNAGASNKLFEFISAGIPVLTFGAYDFQKIIYQYNLGACSESLAPLDIARAICYQLSQPSIVREHQKQAAINVHTELFNYEKQYFPVTLEFENRLAVNTSQYPDSEAA